MPIDDWGLALPSAEAGVMAFGAGTVVLAVGLPFAAATAAAAWRHGASRRGLWVPALWVAVLVAAGAVQAAGGWALVPLAVGMSIGWLVVPAAVLAWTSADVSGVAPGSWWVLATEGGLFLGYGLTGDALSPVLYGVVALLGSAAVLGRLALPTRRAGRRRQGFRLLFRTVGRAPAPR